MASFSILCYATIIIFGYVKYIIVLKNKVIGNEIYELKVNDWQQVDYRFGVYQARRG
jgi:hypothetical protein